MSRWTTSPTRALAIGIVAAALMRLPAAAAGLPRLEADALGGTHVVLPADAAGKPLVLVLAFTKESQDDVKSWSRALLDDRVARTAAVYVVVVADKTALAGHRRVRGLVERATVGTQAQKDSHVLITFDGRGWRELVPPGDKRTAGIVVCDASGAIVYAKRVAFGDAARADVEKAVR